MLERFTNEARHVVKVAHHEAITLHHDFVGTEHALLGLLDPGSGVAHTMLSAVGVDRQRVRTEIERIIGPGADPLGAGDAEALEAIGIDLDTVRAKIEKLFGPGALRPPRPIRRRGLLRRRRNEPTGCGGRRWSPRAKKVLELSLREAVHLGHHHIGPEHILLGLLREGNGLAVRILADAGVDLGRLRRSTLAALDQAA
jgi:ATP-dependent Clp protease ATP-binding subunit ClpA